MDDDDNFELRLELEIKKESDAAEWERQREILRQPLGRNEEDWYDDN